MYIVVSQSWQHEPRKDNTSPTMAAGAQSWQIHYNRVLQLRRPAPLRSVESLCGRIPRFAEYGVSPLVCSEFMFDPVMFGSAHGWFDPAHGWIAGFRRRVPVFVSVHGRIELLLRGWGDVTHMRCFLIHLSSGSKPCK